MIDRVIKKNNTNVAVAPKEPLFMRASDQIDLMVAYTNTHKKYSGQQKLLREMECLKVLFPKVFRPMYEDDLILGRYDALPIGFGSVTSLGGSGHYCNFDKLSQLRAQVPDSMGTVLDDLSEYWKEHDTREIFYRDYLMGDVLGRFVNVMFPAITTARLSGMYLDYNLLLDHGIEGLKRKIQEQKGLNRDAGDEYDVMVEALCLLQDVIDHHIREVDSALNKESLSPGRLQDMERLKAVLHSIREEKPTSFVGAMQLAWFYSSLAGVVNFGRMDDYLGDYLAADLDNHVLTEEEAIAYIQSQWRLIEVKRTNVNGRVIVGGLGRRNPANADVFCRLAIEATRRAKLVEPQFTLRIYTGMDPSIYKAALDSIGEGTTYPILYNDDVNVPSVMHAMNISQQAAQQYVPFGCGEFVISGQGVGTPNTCLNLLKIFDIFLHDGIDQFDYKQKYGEAEIKPISELQTFREFFFQYKKLLDYYVEITAVSQKKSYEVMNQEAGFIFTSILTADCIGRGKMVLDGGVRYLGGTNELYGNMNTADSLAAIKKLVFDDQICSLSEMAAATAEDFDGWDQLRRAMLDAPKYGNDDEYVDEIAKELHEYVCNSIRDSAKKVGLDSFLAVVINNQVNTEWGRATASTPDGRITGLYMSNGNNPQSGADVNGPTAMMNSLVKMRTDIHAGSVQNIKFSKKMFHQERAKIDALFRTYFKSGGPQLMVTIVTPEELEAAYHNPEAYKNLTVRVGGFSARFVNLEEDVQREIIARTLNE